MRLETQIHPPQLFAGFNLKKLTTRAYKTNGTRQRPARRRQMADRGPCSHHKRQTPPHHLPESPSIQVGRVPLVLLLLLNFPPFTYTSRPFMTTQWHVATFCSPQPPLFLILSPHPSPSLHSHLTSLFRSCFSLSSFLLLLISPPHPPLSSPTTIPLLHQPIRLPPRRKASWRGSRASLGTGAGGAFEELRGSSVGNFSSFSKSMGSQ